MLNHGPSLKELPIEDGAIENLVQLEDRHRWCRDGVTKVNNWGALVSRDKLQKGGLAREFLRSRDDGEILILNDTVRPGTYLEMGLRVIHPKHKCVLAKNIYAKICQRSGDKLVIQEVTFNDIP